MTYSRIPEQEQFYKGEQNIIEKIMAGISSTDDFLRLTNIILARQNQLLEILSGQPPSDGGGGTIPSLGIRTVQLIKNVAVLDTDTVVKPVELADCRAANRVIVRISNTLDQTVRVTVIGSISSDSSGGDVIKELTCPSSESRTYGLKLEEWMPYIGVQAQALVTPTSGNLNAIAIVQE